MENLQIYLLGFLAQGFFGGRLLIQWWQSEKKGTVVSPVVYWYLSLAGSLLFMIYGLIRSDIVIVAGQALSYFIYIRNLQLKNAWVTVPVLLRVSIILMPFLVVLPALIFLPFKPEALSSGLLTNPVLLMGAIGQLALNFRFLYQWYYSEKHRTSLLPFGFWSISTWASVMVIVYSLFHPIYKIEPVLLVSQTMGIVVYIRNMILSKRQKVPSV